MRHKRQNTNLPVQKAQRSYLLFGVVTRLVVVSNLYSRSRRAAFWPAIRVLHLHFSQQSQYAVGEVLFSLRINGGKRMIRHMIEIQVMKSNVKKLGTSSKIK